MLPRVLLRIRRPEPDDGKQGEQGKLDAARSWPV
jgi:hypothetical protein